MNMSHVLADAGFTDTQTSVLEYDSIRDKGIDDGVHVRAMCIAVPDPIMRSFYAHNSFEKYPAIAEIVGHELSVRGISHVFAPTADAMSGLMLSDDDTKNGLTRTILPHDVEISYDFTKPWDGISIEPGEAVALILGGCGAVISTGEGHCDVAHFGRKSALDYAYIQHDGVPRTYFSIVDAMAAKAIEVDRDPTNMTFRCLFTLPREVFGHPLKDDKDEKLNSWMAALVRARYGQEAAHVDGTTAYLDMHGLAAAQAKKCGFTIDRTAEHLLPHNGPFAHTRHPKQSMRNRRNLVIVHRLS